MFRSAVDRGVNLQTNTLVTELAEVVDGNGSSRWVVTTNRGIIRAPKVVLATNAYTAALLPEYKDKIIPYRGISCKISTRGQAPLLANSYGLRFAPWDFDYLIPRPDGSIIVGGGRSAYFLAKDMWYANTDDSQGVNEVKRYFEQYMQRHFRGWENSGAYVEDIWTGSKSPFRLTC
jgi:glycine/D-amino acid oxidase-like deaminating enzyme